jgi:hypothetical protein
MTAKASDNVTSFVVTLRPLPNVDPVRALRAALKALLRRYGLRATRVELAPNDE